MTRRGEILSQQSTEDSVSNVLERLRSNLTCLRDLLLHEVMEDSPPVKLLDAALEDVEKGKKVVGEILRDARMIQLSISPTKGEVT